MNRKSNTSIGRGVKGSKFWMQIVVEHQNLQDELNAQIGEPLIWISPLAGKSDTFLEYQLNDTYITKLLGISKAEATELFDFWAKRQPQWDGLAFSQSKETLYLIEAKAHLSELNSKCAASNQTSRALILASLSDTQKKYFPKGSFTSWTDEYYQLANRLTFLKKLNEAPFGNIKKVKLVLLNFTNDNSYIPTAESEWTEHYAEVFTKMTGSSTTPEDTLLIYFDVSKRGIMPDPQTGLPIIKAQ